MQGYRDWTEWELTVKETRKRGGVTKVRLTRLRETMLFLASRAKLADLFKNDIFNFHASVLLKKKLSSAVC